MQTPTFSFSQETIENLRKQIETAMKTNAGGIEDWLWDAMNEALEYDDDLICLFEDYYDTSLIYLGIKIPE